MATVIRIRDLNQETNIDANTLVPVDKSSYGSAARYATMSDIAAYVSGGASAYINTTAVPTTIGGIVAGTTFPSPGKSMQEMFDLLLYPYQYPAFTAFALSESTPQEIGDSFGSGTFTWTTSNSSNVTGSTPITITGYNLTSTPSANDGIQAVSFTASVTRDSSDGVGSRTWNITGYNTLGGTFTDSYTIRWDWMWYYGTSTNTTLIDSEIVALTSSGLYSSYSRTFSFDATVGDTYKYICFADTYGGPSNFVDNYTGYAVAMYGGYGYTQNGYTYDLVSVTNTNAETTNYRVYRTQNPIKSDIDIVVS